MVDSKANEPPRSPHPPNEGADLTEKGGKRLARPDRHSDDRAQRGPYSNEVEEYESGKVRTPKDAQT